MPASNPPVDSGAQNSDDPKKIDTSVNPAKEGGIIDDAAFAVFLRDVVVDEIKQIRTALTGRGPGNMAEQDRLIQWVTIGASHLAGR